MRSPLAAGALLAPRVQAWGVGSRCTRDLDRFGAADVAAIAASVPRAAWDIYCAVYARDADALAAAERWLYVRAVDLARRGHWEVPRGAELIRHLCRAALYEAVAGGHALGGAGQRWRWISAEGQASAAARGRQWGGLSPWTWYHRWRGRYQQVAAMVDREIEVARAVMMGHIGP